MKALLYGATSEVQFLAQGVLVNDSWRMLSGVLKNILFHGALKTRGAKDTTNTSVIHHAGKIFALMEAHKPALLSVDRNSGGNATLRTEATGYDFNGGLSHNFTAHPKVDPETGEMFLFGYDLVTQPHMSYTEISKRGEVQHSVDVRGMSRGTMSHDMAITRTHTILYDFPVVFNVSNIFTGQFPIQFDKTADAKLGVIKRGGKLVKWFNVDRGGNTFHTVNVQLSSYEIADEGQ